MEPSTVRCRVDEGYNLHGDPPSTKAFTNIPYDDEESEFLLAVADFRGKLGRVPTLLEGFWIAELLGWQPVAEPGPVPKGLTHKAFGERKTLQEWADDPRCGVSYGVLCKRLARGLLLEDALVRPKHKIKIDPLKGIRFRPKGK